MLHAHEESASTEGYPWGYGSMAKLPLSSVKTSVCFSSARRASLFFTISPIRVSGHSYSTTQLHGLLKRTPVKEYVASVVRSSFTSHVNLRQFSDRNDRDVAKYVKPNVQQPAGSSRATPLAAKLDDTRPRSKVITDKVRSSLTPLTPHENIYNLPNILTASRLLATPIIGYLVLHGQHNYALALFAYAGITDLVDGWIARRFKLQTVVGSVIDPMADKVLMTVLTVTLAAKGLLPVYLATLILGRDVALAGAAIYYRYASLPAPKTFQRYWDFSLPSAEVHPTTVSKLNTFLQLVLIGSTLAYPVITADNHHLGVMYDLGMENLTLEKFMTYFQWVVAATTAWSGLSYAYLKNAVKILGTDEKLKAKQGRAGRAIIGVTFGSVVAVAAWLAVSNEMKEVPKAEELADPEA